MKDKPSLKTSGEYYAEMRQDRRNAYRIGPEDGPVIVLLKALLGLECWHYPVETAIDLYFRITRTDLEKRVGAREAKARFRKGVEWFWILFSLLLVFAYILAVWLCRRASERVQTGYVPWISSGFILVLALIAAYRVIDIMAASFWLHVLRKYETDAPPHALTMTVLAYVNVLICYGILYLVEAYSTGDMFRAKTPLWTEPVDAAYFSAVTITTLGFGDFSPERWQGKSLVASEVFIGLILIIVTFQRAIAGTKYLGDEDECDRDGRPRLGALPVRSGLCNSLEGEVSVFTGLVEGMGRVASMVSEPSGRRFTIEFLRPPAHDPLVIGESIAVNGCCLTVVATMGASFDVQAGPETLARTNLGDFREGDGVNLERSLRANDRLGGHFVQGHVDDTARLIEREVDGEWEFFRFQTSPRWSPLMVAKGSIAVDGVSLTLVDVDDAGRFSIMLIPHTLAVTTLGARAPGDRVNLEIDILAKHVARLMGRS